MSALAGSDLPLIAPDRVLTAAHCRDVLVGTRSADGSVARADVVTGSRRGGQVEITSGVAAGDRIVVDGSGKLRPGMKVIEAKPQPAATGAAKRQD